MITVTAHSTPPALVMYLRRATWGLPKERAQELWDELEEHVLERADHLCAFGTPYELALRQAVTELGPPAKVSAGMSEVYLMPKLIRAGLIAVISGAMAAFALGGGPQAAVDITYGGPRKLCATCASLPSNQNMVAWLNLDSLQRTLAAQGVKVQQEKKQTVLTFPGIPTKAYLPLSEWYAARGQRYTPTWSLIWGLIGTNAARVSGFDNPVFILGKVALQLGDGSHTLSGYTAYQLIVGQAVSQLLHASESPKVGEPLVWRSGYITKNPDGTPDSTNTGFKPHNLRTSLKSGEVAVLMFRSANGLIIYDFAPVQADGSVRLYSQRTSLTFVHSADELNPYLSNGRATALLAKLTGRLSTLTEGAPMVEVVQPLSPTSDAR